MVDDRYQRVHRWAEVWSQSWFLTSDGRDLLELSDGTPAGWVTHVEAYELLLEVGLAHIGQSVGRPSLFRRVKSMGFDRAVRSWGLRALRESRQIPKADGVAFVLETPTPSMIAPARLVAARVPAERRSVIAADPRVLRIMHGAGLPAFAMRLPYRETRRELATATAEAAEVLEAATEAVPPMLFDDQDLAPIAVERLRSRLGRSLPWVAVERRALGRMLDRLRPAAMAVASDQHRLGRLSVLEASRIGAPVTVLQHGLPQDEVGYVPVVADRIATWSEASAEWFERHGTEPSRLKILGNPRFDAFGAKQSSSHDRDNTCRLLLALSPTALAANQRTVSLALAALAELPSAELVVKLHPGYRGWGWVSDSVVHSPVKQRVTIMHREPLSELLQWADVTVLHRSSVALESLAAGTPVIVVDARGFAGADDDLGDLRLPVVDDSHGLAETVRQLSVATAKTAWLEQRQGAIRRAMGPLDGHSAERIASVLVEDTRRPG